MSLLDSGALWDTYSNKSPPILRGNCRMSQFRPDTRPPHSWSHLAIHRLGTCSTWSQKPIAAKALIPGSWFSAEEQPRGAAFHTGPSQEESVLR